MVLARSSAVMAGRLRYLVTVDLVIRLSALLRLLAGLGVRLEVLTKQTGIGKLVLNDGPILSNIHTMEKAHTEIMAALLPDRNNDRTRPTACNFNGKRRFTDLQYSTFTGAGSFRLDESIYRVMDGSFFGIMHAI